MSRKKDLLKNSFIIFLGKACTQFISILMLPLYTKYLITSEYGIIDLITTYISLLVPILSLDLEMATFRFLIDYRTDKKTAKIIISTVLKTLTIFAMIYLLLYMIISFFINIKYKYLISLVILVYFYSQFFLQVARGMGKNINYSLGCCISGIVTVILNVILIVFFNFKADGMLISMIISNLLMIIYLFLSLDLRKYISFHEYNKNLLKEFLNYSVPLIPNGISWWMVNASDRTVISMVLGVSANGIYAVSNKFSSLFVGMFNVFQLAWAESASVHINDNDCESFFSSVFNSVLRLFACLGIIIISFMPIIFKMFIDPSYNEAYLYVPILMIGMFFCVIVSLYSGLYIALKRTKEVMNTSIVSAIINLVINILFIRKFGLYAASFSTLFGYAFMALYRHFSFKKYMNINIDGKFLLMSFVLFSFVCVCYYIKRTYSIIMMIIISIVFTLINFSKFFPDLILLLKSKRNKINNNV